MRSLKMRNNPRIQQTLTKTLSETRYSWDLKHIYIHTGVSGSSVLVTSKFLDWN